jgi:hypothetical protein
MSSRRARESVVGLAIAGFAAGAVCGGLAGFWLGRRVHAAQFRTAGEDRYSLAFGLVGNLVGAPVGAAAVGIRGAVAIRRGRTGRGR